ncbi:hypothetical protein [Succinimonas sp.]|uniref:hypothetical protein n=1 Tax=Succinimonas sp. TaxID=1936151 RepID=UPI003868C861
MSGTSNGHAAVTDAVTNGIDSTSVTNAVSNGMDGTWIVVLLAVCAVCVVFYLLTHSGKKSGGDKPASDASSSRDNGSKVKATDKERDFLELIHLLALAAEKVDKRHQKD